MCGRRSGKTAGALTTTAEGLLRGERWGWFAPTYRLATEVWREMLDTLGPELIKRADSTERRVELKNGAVWELWTLDGGTEGGVSMPGRSREYHGVVVDEAGLIGALQKLWEGALRPTLAKSRGVAYLIGTPLGRRSDFSTMFERAQADPDGEWFAIRVGTSENPLIPREELESSRAEAVKNGTLGLWEQEWLGIPADDGSNPIGLSAIKRAQGPRSSEPTAAVGIDLAQSVDYTVIYGVDVYGRWTWCERWQAPWSVTKRKIAAWLNTHARDRDGGLVPTCVDSSGVGSPVVSDLHTLGLDVQGVVFTDTSRRALLERLIVDVQGGRVSVPPPTDPQGGFVVSELEALGTEMLPSGKVRYSVPNGMHDDGVMALALCCYAFRAAEQPVWERTVDARTRDNRSTPLRERKAKLDRQTDGPLYAAVEWRDHVSGEAPDGYESVDY
jgi:hypothetical protein